MSVLALHDASVRLGGRAIWEHVDLTVEAGTFTAVLGPNGAGKSTLLKVALGLVPLAAGSVHAPAKREIGYLPQRHHGDGTAPIRGVDLVRLGLDGASWGVPLPRRHDPRRATRRRRDPPRRRRAITRTGPSARSRAGSSSGC